MVEGENIPLMADDDLCRLSADGRSEKLVKIEWVNLSDGDKFVGRQVLKNRVVTWREKGESRIGKWVRRQ